jgi:ABC-type transporter Mla MlaB component
VERIYGQGITMYSGVLSALKMATLDGSKPEVEKTAVPLSGGRRLKYYIHDHSHSFRLQLLGHLTTSDLSELEGCWQTAKPSVAGRKIQLDLLGLSGVDAAGQRWLGEMAAGENLEILVSVEASKLFIPGDNIVVDRMGSPAKICWVDRLRLRLRMGRRAPVTQERVEAAVQTVL